MVTKNQPRIQYWFVGARPLGSQCWRGPVATQYQDLCFDSRDLQFQVESLLLFQISGPSSNLEMIAWAPGLECRAGGVGC